MLILRIVLAIIVLFIAVKLFFFAVGIFTLLAWGLTILLIVGAVCWLLLKFLIPANKLAEPEKSAGPQLYNHSGNVVLFEEKPNLLQITKADETTGGTINLPNGEKISIVEEDENVLKVKVNSGAHKGNVAWVSKSDVTGYKSSS